MPELDALKEELSYLRLWLFVGIALHAGRDKKPPSRNTD
jgi:hypothetical protein